MVGPSLSDDENRIASARLRVGFVLLVGVSAGFVGLAADATVPQAALAFAAGCVVGIVLLAFLRYWGRELVGVNRR